MAMSICESFQSTALAGLGIRPPHWAVLQFLKPPDSSWVYLSSELRKVPLPSAVTRESVSPGEPLEDHVAYQALDRLSQSPLVRQEICSVRMSPISSQ